MWFKVVCIWNHPDGRPHTQANSSPTRPVQGERPRAPATSALASLPWNPAWVPPEFIVSTFPSPAQFTLGSPRDFSTVVTRGVFFSSISALPCPGGPRAGSPAPGSGSRSVPGRWQPRGWVRGRVGPGPAWPGASVPEVLRLLLVSPWDLEGSLVSSGFPASSWPRSRARSLSFAGACYRPVLREGSCDPENFLQYSFLRLSHKHFASISKPALPNTDYFISPLIGTWKWKWSRSVVSDSWRPRGL